MNLLQKHSPRVFDSYMEVIKSLEATCALDPKVRELVLIGILTVTGSVEGLSRHVDRALGYGATKEEILASVVSPLPISGVRCVLQGLAAAVERIEASGKSPAGTHS